MAISRSQMKRQLYEGGGISTLQQARDILEAEALPGESLAYINPQEAAMLKYMGGAGIPINSSGIPSYFFKSIAKAVTKPIKKAVSAVSDFVSSDIGKAALLAAGGYYLGGGNLFGLQRAGMSGFSFGNIPGVLKAKQFLMGTPAYDFGGRTGGILSKLPGVSNLIPGKGSLLSASLGFLGGAATSMLTPQQIETGMKRNPTAVRAYLAQYYKNINPEATEQEAEQYAQEQTREYAAKGGIMGVPMGEPRENQQGVQELDYRKEGGFVPVGIKEKADDVPAMLSKNEFVFTADAVRGAGNGNVEKGAQRLYNTMKTLENGGTV